MTMKNVWARLRDLNDNGVLESSLGAGGKLIWLDGYAGSDANPGTFDAPVKTLGAAYNLGRDGKHDVIVVKNAGNTAALCTVRVDSAFTWSKNCLHLISQSPTRPLFSPRARFAPTGSTTAFANFITMSGNDCVWDGIQLWHGFAAGVAASIALTLSSANRNRFTRCHIATMVADDGADAQSATSRCVKISGGGENFFDECTIGADTVARTQANANVEFAAGTARNVFRKCFFPMYATATSPLAVKVAAAAGADRFQLFDDCTFWNFGASSLKLATLAANIGGKIVFKNPRLFGTFGGFGTDATSQGQILIDGVASGSTVTGIGYAPNA